MCVHLHYSDEGSGRRYIATGCVTVHTQRLQFSGVCWERDILGVILGWFERKYSSVFVKRYS